MSTLRRSLAQHLRLARRFKLLLGCTVLHGGATLQAVGLEDGRAIQVVWLPTDLVLATASTDTTAALWSMDTGASGWAFWEI